MSLARMSQDLEELEKIKSDPYYYIEKYMVKRPLIDFEKRLISINFGLGDGKDKVSFTPESRGRETPSS